MTGRMSTTAVRVVIDTNVLVAIIGRRSPYRWIFDGIIRGDIHLCVSTEIVLEYYEILALKNGPEVAENVVNLITTSPFTAKTEIFYNFRLIQEDEDDNKFVDCAITSDAVCVVSNDGHFQVLKTIDFPSVDVLTVSEFEQSYKDSLTTL